jgi:hypothetical protein
LKSTEGLESSRPSRQILWSQQDLYSNEARQRYLLIYLIPLSRFQSCSKSSPDFKLSYLDSMPTWLMSTVTLRPCISRPIRPLTHTTKERERGKGCVRQIRPLTHN